MVNILIVDDHPAIVEGLKNLFDEPQYLHVVDTADSKEKLMNLLWRRKSVDLIILDIDLPDASGIEVAAILKEKHPQIKILIYSFFAKWKYIEDLERLGVDGYVTKGENMHILLEAIDLISNHGQTYFSKALLKKKEEMDSRIGVNGKKFKLSPREEQTLKYLSEGKSVPDISDETGLKIATINTYKKRLIEKTQCNSVAELVKFAIEQGYI